MTSAHRCSLHLSPWSAAMFGALLGIVAGAVALRQMLSIVPEPAFFMAVAMLAASPRFLADSLAAGGRVTGILSSP